MRLLIVSFGFTIIPAMALPTMAQDRFDDKAVIDRAVEILLDSQESLAGRDSPEEWPYEGAYRVRRQKGLEIPFGYRIGGTAICAWALIETPGWGEAQKRREAVVRANDFLFRSLAVKAMGPDNSNPYDVRGWGQIYALTYFSRALERGRLNNEQKTKVEEWIPQLIESLEKTTFPQVGGWHYLRRGSPCTFMTAAAVQALFAAENLGFEVDQGTLSAAVRSLREARLESGAFQYASIPSRKTGRAIEAIPGSIGRSPICEVTLHVAGQGSIARIELALDNFFRYWRWLEERRQKNGTHRPPYMIAPYYFFFAHYYSAQAIEFLPETKRSAYRAKLRSLFQTTREESGAWNDREFKRSESYSTAMVVLSLLSPAIPSPKAQPARAKINSRSARP